MMLGAGCSQLPAIRKAVALGYQLITVDNLPGNTGHALAHGSVNCSTVDREGVLRAARELAIDGIMTFASDAATPTVGYVAEQLGLPGCPSASALVMSDKSRFRAFQQAAGLTFPVFFVSRDLDAARAWLAGQKPPLVFKPVDSSGSRGISAVPVADDDQYRRAFEYARAHSRAGMVCIEEFLDGIDVSGDGFLINGDLRAVITHKHKQGIVPRGHRLPSELSPADQQQVKRAVAAHCRALDYRDGPLDFDVMVRGGQAVVLEMSPRLGGNGIPSLIERGGEVDLIAATARFAVGESPAVPREITVVRGCGSWILGSAQSGRLARIASGDAMGRAVPEIFDYTLYHGIGDRIDAMAHSANSLGWALFDCVSDAHYRDIVARIQQALDLRVVA